MMSAMNAEQRRAVMTTRLVRLNDKPAMPDAAWEATTMEQRIAAVWDLTLECLA